MLYERLIFLLLWYRIKFRCIYKDFRVDQGRLPLVKLLKSLYELLPFGGLCNLIAKMHNTSKFWPIKFMDANYTPFNEVGVYCFANVGRSGCWLCR